MVLSLPLFKDEDFLPEHPVGPEGPAAPSRVSRTVDNHRLITGAAELPPIAERLAATDTIAVDLETTGLNARKDRTRLMALSTGDECWVIDCASVDPAPLLPILSGKRLVGHNISFDLGFLQARWGFEANSVEDTMLMGQVLHSGEPGVRHSLAEAARREIDWELSKELQVSDWAGALSGEQIAYAATDAAALLPLHKCLAEQLKEAGLSAAAAIENRCVPAMVWMGMAGVPVEVTSWQKLAESVEEDAVRLRKDMDRLAPPPLMLDLGFGWNWDSPQVVKDALLQAGCDIPNANEDTLSSLDHPLADAIRRYRENRKLASTYGLEWLKHLEGARVHPGWRQLGASSGRMACSSPNLQNIPRDPRYRRCLAATEGNVLVKADYSQIELRIAAKVANESRMIRAYETGQDLHTLTAQQVLGKTDVTKSDRQLAKAINFGLLYGMGAEGFRRYARTQYGLFLSPEEAGQYREAFFNAYPRLRAWHRSVRDAHASETRTLSGRRHRLDDTTPLPTRLNLPVQGTGADGLKLALALLWERRAQVPGAVPIIACHDEIVLECPEESAKPADEWLQQAMLDGMAPLIQPIPVAVEVQIGRTWAGA